MASTPSTPDDFIVLTGVSKSFGGNYAVKSMDLTFRRGEVHCLVGANGCGKSTLMKIISGTYTPDEGGVIAVDGRRFSSLTPNESRELGIQVIYQDLALFPNLSVFENIAFELNLGFALSPYHPRELRARAKTVMDDLGFAINLDTTVETLPIAQRQQIAIARALVADARLVIMDEPTASLTRIEVNHLMETVRYLKSKGITVLFVNHRLDEVLEISDRVTVMRDGLKIGTFNQGEVDTHRLAELITGSKIHFHKRSPKTKASETILETKNLSRGEEYRDISLTLGKGEVLGICGLLGSGRTELALTLFGITKPSGGEILVRGKPTKFASHSDAIAHGIGYLSEDRLTLGLIQPQSVGDNLVITILKRLCNDWGMIQFKKVDETIDQWVKNLDIKTSDYTNPVSTLSGGNQQKVVLAKWIATNPDILILDSPTVGVDVGAKDGIYRLVEKLSDQGLAIILISDEVPEVYYNCDRVLHFRRGRIEGEYLPSQISEKELSEVINEG